MVIFRKRGLHHRARVERKGTARFGGSRLPYVHVFEVFWRERDTFRSFSKDAEKAQRVPRVSLFRLIAT